MPEIATVQPDEEMPEFLEPLRTRSAELIEKPAEELSGTLVTLSRFDVPTAQAFGRRQPVVITSAA